MECEAIIFNEISKTAPNDEIDKIIQDTQLLTHNDAKEAALEWIPYDRLYDIIIYCRKIIYV
jgi:hypothetical protein